MATIMPMGHLTGERKLVWGDRERCDKPFQLKINTIVTFIYDIKSHIKKRIFFDLDNLKFISQKCN